jgi:formylglycine-generating enzyme required for sulfatase activity
MEIVEGSWPNPGCVFRDKAPDGKPDDTLPEMVVIPPGEFWMGSLEGEPERRDNEGPRHRVRIARPFALGRFAVTQREWVAVMGENPSGFKGDDLPVEMVAWEDCQAFIEALNGKLGLKPEAGYRLPSEAEWEYACRAGTETPFWWGKTITPNQANYAGNYGYNGGPTGEYRNRTVPVRSFDPNPFGLYQMHGNVWEWVEDCWNEGYAGAPTDGTAWTTFECNLRVRRGGSWGVSPRFLRSAYRFGSDPVDRGYLLGFRVARTLP